MLEPFRAVFRRRGTFTLFTVLATGMVAQTGRRSVVGMLAGARMAGVVSFHAACRFFSTAVWDVDRLGLVAARWIGLPELKGHGPPMLTERSAARRGARPARYSRVRTV